MDMALSPQGGPPISGLSASTKEGALQYRAGSTYLGREVWKSCYLVLRYLQVTHARHHPAPLRSICSLRSTGFHHPVTYCLLLSFLLYTNHVCSDSDWLIRWILSFLAVRGSCTCMQNEPTWPLCCQSPWGELQPADVLTRHCRTLQDVDVFSCPTEEGTVAVAVAQTAQSVRTPSTSSWRSGRPWSFAPTMSRTWPSGCCCSASPSPKG